MYHVYVIVDCCGAIFIQILFQALVESGREKDKLFGEHLDGTQGGSDGGSRRGAGDKQALSPSQMAQLQQLRDEVVRLTNDLHNKQGKRVVMLWRGMRGRLATSLRYLTLSLVSLI